MTQKKERPRLYRPVHSFSVNLDAKGNVTTDGSGSDVAYREDGDLIFEGDPILKALPHLFTEIKP